MDSIYPQLFLLGGGWLSSNSSWSLHDRCDNILSFTLIFYHELTNGISNFFHGQKGPPSK